MWLHGGRLAPHLGSQKKYIHIQTGCGGTVLCVLLTSALDGALWVPPQKKRGMVPNAVADEMKVPRTM